MSLSDLTGLMNEYEAANNLTGQRISEVAAHRQRVDFECRNLVSHVQAMSRKKEEAADELSTLDEQLRQFHAKKVAFEDEYKKSCSFLADASSEEHVLRHARMHEDERMLREISICNSKIRTLMASAAVE